MLLIFLNLNTVQTDSEMVFTQIGDKTRGPDSLSTKIYEKVYFDCSPILSIFCFREIRGTKKLIYDNIINSVDMMLV